MSLSTKDDLAAALGHIYMAISKIDGRIATTQPTRECVQLRGLKTDLVKLHAELATTAVLIVQQEEAKEED